MKYRSVMDVGGEAETAVFYLNGQSHVCCLVLISENQLNDYLNAKARNILHCTPYAYGTICVRGTRSFAYN